MHKWWGGTNLFTWSNSLWSDLTCCKQFLSVPLSNRQVEKCKQRCRLAEIDKRSKRMCIRNSMFTVPWLKESRNECWHGITISSKKESKEPKLTTLGKKYGARNGLLVVSGYWIFSFAFSSHAPCMSVVEGANHVPNRAHYTKWEGATRNLKPHRLSIDQVW